MRAVVRFKVLSSVLLMLGSQFAIADQSLLGYWDCRHGNERHSLHLIYANLL